MGAIFPFFKAYSQQRRVYRNAIAACLIRPMGSVQHNAQCAHIGDLCDFDLGIGPTGHVNLSRSQHTR
jgi:hypothetical protein